MKVIRQGAIVDHFLANFFELALCDVFSRAIRGHIGKDHIDIAMVGRDPHLLGNTEAMRDYNISIVGFFGNHKGDIWFQTKPLSELTSHQYDAIIVGGESPRDEQQLLAGLATCLSPESARPILRIAELRESIRRTIATLNNEHFSTCLNITKLLTVAMCLANAGKGGSILECGAFMGGTSIFMASLLREWNDERRVHICDTFSGMPAPTKSDGDTIYQEGLFQATTLPLVQRHVDVHGLNERVEFHKGLVQDTLPAFVSNQTGVSFALVDTDQYLGTLGALQHIMPNLVTNGIVLIDDYSLQGVRQAVDEIKQSDPTIGGTLISFNFYMLWKRTTGAFFSGLHSASALQKVA